MENRPYLPLQSHILPKYIFDQKQYHLLNGIKIF